MSDLRERLIALADDAAVVILLMDCGDRGTFRSLAIAAARMAQDDCIEIIRASLVHNSQRAVSWHEIQDCIEAIYARAETVK